MNIYKLTQNQASGWDTYDSCVVVAEDEESARLLRPSWGDTADSNWPKADEKYGVWAWEPTAVKVELIGIAADGLRPGTLICASFNAG